MFLAKRTLISGWKGRDWERTEVLSGGSEGEVGCGAIAWLRCMDSETDSGCLPCSFEIKSSKTLHQNQPPHLLGQNQFASLTG
jgi:hypothetical protein